jgi:hypothetical protein
VSGTATHINGLFRLHEFSCNKDVNSNGSVKTFAVGCSSTHFTLNLCDKWNTLVQKIQQLDFC